MNRKLMTAGWRTIALALSGAIALAACSTSSGGSGSPSTSAAAASSSPSSAPSSSAESSSASTQDAAALYTKAKAALLQASSVRIAGVVVSGADSTALDLAYAKTGASGFVTYQGAKIDLIVIKPTAYFRAPDDFWRKQLGAKASAVLPIVSGKWIAAPTSNPQFAAFNEFADKTTFANKLFSGTSETEVTIVDGKTINGVETVGLKDQAGSLLYVAKDDARPIQVEPAPGSGDKGKVTFDQYGSVKEPTPPPANLTIDLSKLAGI